MNLSDDGESRIRGYLFMLESSLRTFLKRDVVADAVREVESHVRERVRETEPMPNERDALNRLLDAIGPPHRLARAYSAELAVDEAVSSGRLWSTARAVFALALNTTEGFAVGVALLLRLPHVGRVSHRRAGETDLPGQRRRPLGGRRVPRRRLGALRGARDGR